MSKQVNLSFETLQFENLTQKNWKLFEDLMGEKGGCGNCWCMCFRLPAREFKANKPNGNKKRMHQLVLDNQPVGLLAVHNKQAIGWIALSPREDLLRIENARSQKRIDDKPVWSVSCFFVKKEFRNQGLSGLLLKGAIDYARQNGLPTLEAYPAIPYAEKVPPPFLWTGILSVFTNCGFTVVQKNGNSKAMVRLEI